ncbi:MAG: GGDEF domain-containing protein [Okeania sp. SIO2C2]|nr:GGDEF domain-containing protein [Okeania sp. SIO2C2]
MILCDVGYFKNYNDYYGHLAGDDCLRKIAQTISKNIKGSADLVARYGGEEFGIILPDTSAKKAKKVAELILAAIHQLHIDHCAFEIRKYITVSIGIASIIPTQLDSSESLIAKADQALYQAKEQDRDRIVFFDNNDYKHTQTYLKNNNLVVLHSNVKWRQTTLRKRVRYSP